MKTISLFAISILCSSTIFSMSKSCQNPPSPPHLHHVAPHDAPPHHPNDHDHPKPPHHPNNHDHPKPPPPPRPPRPRHVDYDQGHSVEERQMMQGYNAPARYNVKGCWDIFITGTFLYWQPREGGMTYASKIDNAVPASGRLPIFGANLEEVDFKYTTAFKVAFGLNSGFDNWDIYMEYTWFRSTLDQSVTVPGGGRLLMLPWFDTANNINGSNNLVSRAASKWKLSLNLVDFEIARPYYVGKKLTLRPHMGARAAFNRQRFDVSGDFVNLSNALRNSHNKQDSWGAGGRAGIDAHWLLGAGLRIQGNLATSLLYTRFKIDEDEDTVDAASVTSSAVAYTLTQRFHAVRPNLDVGLGLGWGSYFADHTAHFDLSATYDFHMFWSENYMYALSQSKPTGETFKPEDLYLHGLTISGRFDF